MSARTSAFLRLRLLASLCGRHAKIQPRFRLSEAAVGVSSVHSELESTTSKNLYPVQRSAQFKMVSRRPGKAICAPRHLFCCFDICYLLEAGGVGGGGAHSKFWITSVKTVIDGNTQRHSHQCCYNLSGSDLIPHSAAEKLYAVLRFCTRTHRVCERGPDGLPRPLVWNKKSFD